MVEKVHKSEEEWRKQLTSEQYRVARQAGTEQPFTGQYWKFKGRGVYRCVACGQELFNSDTKFDSGTGWPSFGKPLSEDAVEERRDDSLLMRRTEVICSQCGSHLGHVFTDGPAESGLRYCMNSASLDFEPREPEKKE